MAYFTDNDDILCPNCGTAFNKDDWHPGDGDIDEITCDDCGKKYTIAVDARYSYTTQCGDEDTDECEWEPYLLKGEIKRAQFGDEEHVYAQCVKCHETHYVLPEKLKTT
jgi:ssDNA-binding Zn-finger/Zn-ribbon topoisomerase 1